MLSITRFRCAALVLSTVVCPAPRANALHQLDDETAARRQAVIQAVDDSLASQNLGEAEERLTTLIASVRGQDLPQSTEIYVYSLEYRLRSMQLLSSTDAGDFLGSEDMIGQFTLSVDTLASLFNGQIRDALLAGRISNAAVAVSRLQHIYIEAANVLATVEHFQAALELAERAQSIFDANEDIMREVVPTYLASAGVVHSIKQERWKALDAQDDRMMLIQKIQIAAEWAVHNAGDGSPRYSELLHAFAERFPDDPRAYGYSREAMEVDQDIDVNILEAVLLKNPDKTSVLYCSNLISLGNLLLQRGKTRDALAKFEESIDSNCPRERLAEAHVQIATCLRILGDSDGALKHLGLSKALGGKFAVDEQIAELTESMTAPPRIGPQELRRPTFWRNALLAANAALLMLLAGYFFIFRPRYSKMRGRANDGQRRPQ